jgi:23S rRNA pseudouridine2457 synthase
MRERLILLNKPFNVLCQFSDATGSKRTPAEFVRVEGVYPAGRLDYDSEGLVLLTNAGWLQHRIADPAWKAPKTYWAQVEGIPEDAAITRLRAGVELKDGWTLPAEAARMETAPEVWERVPPIRERKSIPTAWISLTLREGRNRQVRRMTAAVGHPTLRLIRVRVGEWELGGLKPGEWREVAVPTRKGEGNP